MSRLLEWEVHPAAEQFPLLEGEEYEELCRSVAKVGIINPIVLCEGKILDGRNRVRAAMAAAAVTGVDAKVPTYPLPEGVDPAEYVQVQNILRRHLTPKERAATVIKLMELSGELEAARREAAERQRRGTSASDGAEVKQVVARRAGVSPKTAERVIAEKKADPEAFEDVVAAARGPRPKGAITNRPRAPRAARRSPKRRAGAKYLSDVPNSIPGIASYLKRRFPSTDIARLVKILSA